jgi:DNA (cytosine-5)-methyltransferase 1
MQKGNLDIAPIWTDFKTFDGSAWRGIVDLFFAGIPCQPHSLAGKRVGKSDERNLWVDMARITREMEPRYVIVENVPGLFTSQSENIIDPSVVAPEIRFVSNKLPAYGLQIIGELQTMGYLVFKFNLSASAVGANHRRDRVFIIGVLSDSKKQRKRGLSIQQRDKRSQGLYANRHSEDVPNTLQSELERMWSRRHQKLQACKEKTKFMCSFENWSVEPDVGRVANGVPFRVDRIKALGNAVVPQVAYEVGKIILKIEEFRHTTKNLD